MGIFADAHFGSACEFLNRCILVGFLNGLDFNSFLGALCTESSDKSWVTFDINQKTTVGAWHSSGLRPPPSDQVHSVGGADANW